MTLLPSLEGLTQLLPRYLNIYLFFIHCIHFVPTHSLLSHLTSQPLLLPHSWEVSQGLLWSLPWKSSAISQSSFSFLSYLALLMVHAL